MPDVSRLMGDAFDFHRQALNLQAARQTRLAANIANADTPNYRATDLDFRQALEAAMGASSTVPGGLVPLAPVALQQTTAGHLAGGLPATEAFAFERPSGEPSADGNTVDMDVERAAFAENTMHYEASLTFVNGMFRTMQRAIDGQ